MTPRIEAAKAVLAEKQARFAEREAKGRWDSALAEECLVLGEEIRRLELLAWAESQPAIGSRLPRDSRPGSLGVDEFVRTVCGEGG